MNNKGIKFFDDDDWKVRGIHFLGDKSNEDEIVISSDNREFVRGNLLYFKYEGIEISCDIDEVIYINKKTNRITILKNKKLTPPEEREYLVLLSFYNYTCTYQGVKGRQATFDYIKSIVEEIDIKTSMVLAETVAFKDGISVYDFMNRCIIDEMVQNDDGFDINEYYFAEDEEEEQ